MDELGVEPGPHLRPASPNPCRRPQSGRPSRAGHRQPRLASLGRHPGSGCAADGVRRPEQDRAHQPERQKTPQARGIRHPSPAGQQGPSRCEFPPPSQHSPRRIGYPSHSPAPAGPAHVSTQRRCLSAGKCRISTQAGRLNTRTFLAALMNTLAVSAVLATAIHLAQKWRPPEWCTDRPGDGRGVAV